MSKIEGIISILVERCAVLTVPLGDILVVAAPPDVAADIAVVVGRVAPAADEGVATEVAVAIVQGAAPASLVEVLEQELKYVNPVPMLFMTYFCFNSESRYLWLVKH